MKRSLYNWAWPSFECQQCVGQEYWQGCYCDYYGASCPGGPGPEWWRLLLRRLWNFGWRNSLSAERIW